MKEINVWFVLCWHSDELQSYFKTQPTFITIGLGSGYSIICLAYQTIIYVAWSQILCPDVAIFWPIFPNTDSGVKPHMLFGWRPAESDKRPIHSNCGSQNFKKVFWFFLLTFYLNFFPFFLGKFNKKYLRYWFSGFWNPHRPLYNEYGNLIVKPNSKSIQLMIKLGMIYALWGLKRP